MSFDSMAQRERTLSDHQIDTTNILVQIEEAAPRAENMHPTPKKEGDLLAIGHDSPFEDQAESTHEFTKQELKQVIKSQRSKSPMQITEVTHLNQTLNEETKQSLFKAENMMERQMSQQLATYSDANT